MWPKMYPPPWKNSTAEPGVAPSLVYQRIWTCAPSSAIAWWSVVSTSPGMGWAAPAAPMMGSQTARRAAISPTGGGVKPAIGASAAAISGSKAKDMAALSSVVRRLPDGGSDRGREDDDLARQGSRSRPGV